jgi:hypothetical protein
MSKNDNFCYDEAATSVKKDTLATEEDLEPADCRQDGGSLSSKSPSQPFANQNVKRNEARAEKKQK